MTAATTPSKPLVIFLMGPTASGKTDLAIALRKVLPVDVISVDSALIYRGMDIGTAKPSIAELALAPHRLIDICDPAESYSAAEFRRDALREINAIVEAGRIPLLVGGTMLYFKALLEGMADMPQADSGIRAEIQKQAAIDGWPAIHQQLAAVDPQMAAQIHPNHSQRLCRAMEVFRITGKTMTAMRAEQRQCDLREQYNVVQIAMAPHQRQLLHKRIEQRYYRMMEQGFLGEVEALRQDPRLNIDLPAIRAVGYRQVWGYLDGEYAYAEMLEKGIAATRQLAKRQLTWLRGWNDLNWLYIDTEEGILKKNPLLLSEVLNFIPISVL